MSDPDRPVYPALSQQQLARVDALMAARRSLGSHGFASSGAVEAVDLVAVASWIVTGEDPWPGAIDEPLKAVID